MRREAEKGTNRWMKDGQVIWGEACQYNAIGFVTNLAFSTGEAAAYGYDAFGRLTGERTSRGGQTLATAYAYDALDNRIAQLNGNLVRDHGW